MIRIHVICEGQTEETFVNELLVPHFAPKSIVPIPALIGKPGQKGGGVKFARLFIDIRNRLHDKTAYCTTFFDFYGLPADFPGKRDANSKKNIEDKAASIQTSLSKALEKELGTSLLQRFIPYVQMYEYESLLFSDATKFASGISKPALQSQLQRIRNQFPTPEEINDNPNTAPSKRILKILPEYEKPFLGVLAADTIGLPVIRRECRLFDAWLTQLENLPELKT